MDTLIDQRHERIRAMLLESIEPSSKAREFWNVLQTRRAQGRPYKRVGRQTLKAMAREQELLREVLRDL